jgi:hypothetical protein
MRDGNGFRAVIALLNRYQPQQRLVIQLTHVPLNLLGLGR